MIVLCVHAHSVGGSDHNFVKCHEILLYPVKTRIHVHIWMIHMTSTSVKIAVNHFGHNLCSCIALTKPYNMSGSYFGGPFAQVGYSARVL